MAKYLKIVIKDREEPIFLEENVEKAARQHPDFKSEDGSAVAWVNEKKE